MTQARLIAKATADGLYEFNDDVELGKIYNIDLAHAQAVQFLHIEKNIVHVKTMVKDLDNPGWLPLECLAVES
jgi:hypothetical protein